ncbi:MAG TPA: hypothetical protein VIK68_05780 [Sphingomicrobium sp.]
MKQLLLFAGAAALGVAAPAAAKPGMGHGPGMGMSMSHGNPHAMGLGNPHGIGFGARPSGAVGFGAGGCPPGLAKKAVPCMPPGLAKHQFGIGERIPMSVGGLLPFSALPRTIRTHHAARLDRHSRFLMTNRSIVSVNPRTRVVENVIPMR